MTGIKYLEWILSGLFGAAVVLGISYAAEKIQNKVLKILIFIVKFILMIGLALALIAFASPFLWKFNYPLSGIYIALLADCMCDIVMAVCSLFREEKTFKFRAVIFSVITVLVFVYGTVNSQMIRADHMQVTSSKLNQKHTFVFLSDLHYGSSQRQDTVEKALNEIREFQPEFVLLGGDICDEHTLKDEMEWTFEQLVSLNTPVYYIYGNHDNRTGS